MKNQLFCVFAALSLLACQGPPPTEEEVREKVGAANQALTVVKHALELLGIWPRYECGTENRLFGTQAADGLRAQLSCAQVTNGRFDDVSDAVSATFPEEGCAVGEKRLGGSADLVYSGGEDRFAARLMLDALLIDGTPVPATVGYAKCSDQATYWAQAIGSVAPDAPFAIDASATTRDGLPLIGSTDIILNGTGQVTTAPGVDRVSFFDLAYTWKEYLPHDGGLLVETSSGHTVRVHFENQFWRLGRARVQIDDEAPQVIPIIH